MHMNDVPEAAGLPERELLLQDRQPSDVINPEWLPEYKKQLAAIWNQLWQLNMTMKILGRLRVFRFDLFVEGEATFWSIVQSALWERCIMAVWRIAVDSDSDVLTLRHLKNQITQNMRTDGLKAELIALLKQIGFEKTVGIVTPKIRAIRCNYLAHNNREKNTRPTPQDIKDRKLSFTDLQSVMESLARLFEPLCFAQRKALVTPDYDDWEYDVPVDNRTDIEKLLDEIAKSSPLLNMPERDARLWVIMKADKSPDDLQVINTYRAKFGLPAV